MKSLRLKKGGIPLYVQLEQILRSDVMIGKFMPGEKIPTEKEIANMYKVSIITVRQAIKNLVQEGLLIREQGRGTFVQNREGLAKVKNIMTLSVKGDIHQVIPENLMSQKVRVLDMVKLSSSKRFADILAIDEGQEIMQIRRVREQSGMPVSYIKNYMRAEIGEKITKEDLLNYPMIYILRNKLRVPINRGVQYISAIIADYELSNALSLKIASPLLYLETTIYDDKDKPVEFVQTFYRSDQFKYTIALGFNEITVV